MACTRQVTDLVVTTTTTTDESEKQYQQQPDQEKGEKGGQWWWQCLPLPSPPSNHQTYSGWRRAGRYVQDASVELQVLDDVRVLPVCVQPRVIAITTRLLGLVHAASTCPRHHPDPPHVQQSWQKTDVIRVNNVVVVIIHNDNKILTTYSASYSNSLARSHASKKGEKMNFYTKKKTKYYLAPWKKYTITRKQIKGKEIRIKTNNGARKRHNESLFKMNEKLSSC